MAHLVGIRRSGTTAFRGVEHFSEVTPKDVRNEFKEQFASKGFVVKAVGETKLIVSDGQGRIEITSISPPQTPEPKITPRR